MKEYVCNKCGFHYYTTDEEQPQCISEFCGVKCTGELIEVTSFDDFNEPPDPPKVKKIPKYTKTKWDIDSLVVGYVVGFVVAPVIAYYYYLVLPLL